MTTIAKYRQQVDGYCQAVLSGARVVGRMERLAVLRYLHERQNPGIYGFDEARAAAACEFFPAVLRHVQGEWRDQIFVLSDPQAFIVWNLFGWRREDGTRRFRYAYITCARKFGKSAFASGLGLLLTTFDDPIEPAAQVYCAATKEDQARIVHEVAKQMVNASPVLRSEAQTFAKSIATPAYAAQPHSFFKPLGSDSRTTDGLNVHGAILDEIHEWRDRHRGLWEKLTTASGARRQPLIVIITTAGDDFSVLWDGIDKFCVQALETAVTAAPVGPTWFAFIARIDDATACECKGQDAACGKCGGSGTIAADDPFDEAVWPKANPHFPITPKLEYLREQAEDAKNNPAARHAFVRYYCNQRVSAREKAIEPGLWHACGVELSDWESADVVCGGWDLGGRDDLAAVGAVARFSTGCVDDEGAELYRYELRAKAFINANTQRDLAREPFASWIASGQLTVSQNELNDVRRVVADWQSRYHVAEWAFDPHNSRDLAQALETEGVKSVAFYQNCGMYNEPLRSFLAAMKRGGVRHGGDSMLTWCALNVVIKSNARNEWMPDKAGSAEKIDAFVACLMAYRLCTLAKPRASGSLYLV